MDAIDKYNLTCAVYKKIKPKCKNIHQHHIKPKSIYPDLANNYKNIVNVSAIVHWALHEWLNEYLKATNNPAYEKLQYVDVASYINNNTSYKIDFTTNRDKILDYIFNEVKKFWFKNKQCIINYNIDKCALRKKLVNTVVFKGSHFYYSPDLCDKTIIVKLEKIISEFNLMCAKQPVMFKGCFMNCCQISNTKQLIDVLKNKDIKCISNSRPFVAKRYGYANLLVYADISELILYIPESKILSYSIFNDIYKLFKFNMISAIDISAEKINNLTDIMLADEELLSVDDRCQEYYDLLKITT